MAGYWSRFLLIVALPLFGCTSDPNAPVNQVFPIKQMDTFFDSLSAPPPPPAPPDYTLQPGYAPAYPPYAPQLMTEGSAIGDAVE